MLPPYFSRRLHAYQHCVLPTNTANSRGIQAKEPFRSFLACIPPQPMQRSRLTFVYKHPTLLPPTSYISSLCTLPTSSCFWLFSNTSCFLILFQWYAGGLRARSSELLHFISLHSVDLIYIQESNLDSSSSFRVPGYSGLRSDRTHSQSGMLFPDNLHASRGVIIFVRKGLSFSKVATFFLSLCLTSTLTSRSQRLTKQFFLVLFP